MNPPSPPDPRHGASMEADPAASYTLDVVASVSGVSTRSILHYHEQGLVRPVHGEDAETGTFNDDTVRRLRLIEHLREDYGMNLAALRLALSLMDEVDQLRSELRMRR